MASTLWYTPIIYSSIKTRQDSSLTSLARIIGNIILLMGASAVIIFAFLPEGTFQYPYILSLVMNAMHFPAGFFFSFFCFVMVPFIRRHHWLLLVIGTVFFAGIEYFQSMIGRTSSLTDLIVSDLGVFFGWLFIVSKRRFGRKARYLSLTVSLGIFSYLITPGATAIYNAYQAQQIFPQLIDMESSVHSLVITKAEERIVRKPHPQDYVNNHYYLRYNKPDTKWPGINLRIIQQDWRGYSHLCFEAKGEIEKTRLIVRFDDQDSVNGSNNSTHTLWISNEWEDYCMDYPALFEKKQDHIDISRMKELKFFLDHRMPGAYFDLDNITLN